LLGASAVATSANELGHPKGWEVVIDCTGVVAAIEDGFTRVRKGGSFLQFGVSEENAQVRFSPYRIYNEEITVLGSMAVLNSFGPALELMAAGAIDAEAMLTHDFPLDGFADALANVRGGEGVKSQVLPGA
jgi:threonine dehydrogenase-like Zn-dependent dehydrogenase